MLECVAHVLTRNYADKAIRDARWGRFTISKLTLALPGVKVTIGIRVVATLNLAYSEVSVPIYVDLLGFADGPAEVLLSTASVTQPMPAATEQEMLELLLTRARAHSLVAARARGGRAGRRGRPRRLRAAPGPRPACP